MNYKKMLANIRKEIICSIENKLAELENGTALLFNNNVDATTYIDRICGEVLHLNGIIKGADGDIYFFSEDTFNNFGFDTLNTEDLGEILDKLISTSYEYVNDWG